jgi:hypothetical protein
MCDDDSAQTESQPSAPEVEPNEVEPRPRRVEKIEEESLRHLMSLAKKLAPHLGDSPILDEDWWEEHRFITGIHVSLVLTSGFLTETHAGMAADVQIRSPPSGADNRTGVQ